MVIRGGIISPRKHFRVDIFRSSNSRSEKVSFEKARKNANGI
jgi:hypothetical protein